MEESAIKCGAYQSGWWDLTPREMHAIIESKINDNSAKSRETAVMAYHNACLTGIAITNGRNFPRRAIDYQPFSFIDTPEAKLARTKAEMQAFAARNNALLEAKNKKKGGTNDSR